VGVEWPALRGPAGEGAVSASATHHVTKLLVGWAGGDDAALDRLTPLVHQELRRIARRHMAHERAGHVLQPTALVNEAYLRLVDVRRVRWNDRAHFFAMAARLMRRILVDDARARAYQKRGGGRQHVTLDDQLLGTADRPQNLVALDDALNALTAVDPRRGRVVELRFFAGLSVEETATVLKISPETVTRDWRLAKTWLLRELSRSPPDGR
jgi:RNA polymerase sigma factor (TIGR02999 family)